MSKLKAKEKCEVPTCSGQAQTKGRCSACYQGGRRLATRNATYLRQYLYSRRRLYSRAVVEAEERSWSVTKIRVA